MLGHFGQTAGIALERDGSFLVVDRWEHRLLRLGQNGEVLAIIGSRGSAPGQFEEPNDLALDQDGSIYVADYKNRRVQKLAPDGTPVTAWEAQPVGERTDLAPGLVATGGGHLYAHFWAFKGPARLRHFAPSGEELEPINTNAVGLRSVTDMAASADGTLYIVDKIDSAVRVYTPTGQELALWGKGGSGSELQLWQPSAVTVAPDGNISILDQDGKRVQIVTPAGQILATREPLPTVHGIVVSPDGSLFITPGWGSPISEIAPTGEIVRSIGISYAEPWIVRYAERVDVDPSGNVLALAGGTELQVFSPTGSFIERRPLGSAIRQLELRDAPRVMTMTLDGSLYIVAEDRVVVRITPDGQVAGRWRIGDEPRSGAAAREGSGDNTDSSGRAEPRIITDIAVDRAGAVYITDDLSLYKLATDGAQIARWFGDDINPQGQRDRFFGHRVTVGPDDLLYVASRNYVYKLTLDGQLLARIGNQPDAGQAGGPLTFSSVNDVVVDPAGTIYVTHSGRNPVQMLSPAGELLAMWGTPDGKPDPDSHLPAAGSSMALTPDGALLLAAGDRILKLSCRAAE